ncbi:response regulator transcription factor [Planctopirus hydrillae]|uniref:DNA-binding response regulator n=1 Tax=Planctopirus hydrillae TaxID=1841610 RepID=A0A1C3ELS0_9PLAN|nr:response regulator transcription factor [Planctopirus hydrillae]ODA34197.1 hypothetical protein A6X21_17665 [Planctopirus hydrillae]
MNVLVIEDDPAIGRSLQQGFSEAGHHCVWQQNGTSGYETALSRQADAIVLDLLLPGESGWDVLQKLRAAGVQAPIILLTALGSVDDRVKGLKLGADDYLVKPFDFAELMARLEAVQRRTGNKPSMILQAAGLTLDLTTRRVTSNDTEKEIDLTPIEFSLLELLMRYAGQVVTRKMLCEHVWGFNWDGTTNVIEVHVNRLRGKLDKDRDQSIIKTVRGRGYALPAS